MNCDSGVGLDSAIAVITRLVQVGFQASCLSADGLSPLHIACQLSDERTAIRVVSAIVGSVDDDDAVRRALDALSLDGTSVLSIACQRGHTALVRELVRHGARPEDGELPEGSTRRMRPIVHLVKSGCTDSEVYDLLLSESKMVR